MPSVESLLAADDGGGDAPPAADRPCRPCGPCGGGGSSSGGGVRRVGRPGLHTARAPQGPGGELLVTDPVSGATKSVGHRSQRRFFKQHFPAAEQRDSVLAAQRERLLLM
jgi:hypothetical protein